MLAALSQKKISCAAFKSATDSADRSQSIVIYDVQEVENEIGTEKVSEVPLEASEKLSVTDC